PDLQDESVKHIYEEKLKLINEAYEVLSNEEKRKQYDLELARKEPNTENLLNENVNNISNEYQEELLRQQQLEYQRQVQQTKEKAYYDAYIQDLKNRGYKIRYKKTFSDYVKNFIALTCTIFILFLLWQLPFVKKFFISMYNENPVLKAIVDLFHNFFISLFNNIN
ncbi:MAG: DnaJ domain-containing protein, partial [Clostridia bacterium]|nr:DnaJ domain-containing protein [Clostridia bacterium]